MSTHGRGRSKAQAEVLGRFFEGLPVKDAQKPLLIVADKRDARGAVPGDPHQCVIARACGRLFNSSALVILRWAAYVDLPNEKGERELLRFHVPPPTRRAIVEFDKTGVFPPGGFELRPFCKSLKLDASRQRDKRRRTAILKGAHKPRASRRQPEHEDILTLEGVRSGTGMVHFTKKAA